MKKIKENKGITLIALIITIIVLIILAVVAINAVQGDGIIAHAKNARDDYQTAQEEENSILANYQTELDNINNNKEDTLNGTYYLHGGNDTGNGIFSYLKIENENIQYYEDEYRELYTCTRNINDDGIIKIEDSSTNGKKIEYFKFIDNGILIIGNKEDKDSDITWYEYFLYIDETKCNSKVNFTLLDGMKFNIPDELCGGGTLKIQSRNRVHYWENDEDEYLYPYCIYNNKLYVLDQIMDIIYNEKGEVIALEEDGYRCNRIYN